MKLAPALEYRGYAVTIWVDLSAGKSEFQIEGRRKRTQSGASVGATEKDLVALAERYARHEIDNLVRFKEA